MGLSLGAALAGASLGGCSREFNEEDDAVARLHPLPAGAALSIAGVRLGDARSVLEARLERVPQDIVTPSSAQFRDRLLGGVHVVFDTEGRARELYGSTAHAEGRAVIWQGMSPKAVQAVLGPGRRKAWYRPRGSGVISLAQEYAGEEVAIERDGVAWTFLFGKDKALTGIVARPVVAAPRR